MPEGLLSLSSTPLNLLLLLRSSIAIAPLIASTSMAYSDSQDGPSQLVLHGSLVFTSLQSSVEAFASSRNSLQSHSAKSRWSGDSSAPFGDRVFSLSPA